MNSDSALFFSFSFTTSAYLNTFTPPPFICVCIHPERDSWTQRETLVPFFFIFFFYVNVDPGWPPSVQTVSLYDSPASPAINIRRRFTPQIIHTSRFISPLLCFPPLFVLVLTPAEVVCHFQQTSDFCLTSSHTLVSHFPVASGAFFFFAFLIPRHKEKNLLRLSRNPAYTYLLLGTFFLFFYPITAFH